jgi:CheY-like chemotaxis protein
MRILVIDDKREEREAAKAAVEAAGHEAIVFADMSYPQGDKFWETMRTVDGVITDLYFNPNRSNDRVMATYRQTPPAMGLLVALHALHLGKPVVICTSGDHHGAELSFVYDAYVGPNLSNRNIAFGWDEAKDWARSVKMLEKGVKTPWDLKED